MFFYSEPSQIVVVPLTLLSNTSSIYLDDACVGASSQITFTVSSTGNTTETVTLSDDSNQFDFSPSSFILTGSITSQVVTVTFTPTKPWGLKSGNLILSASGGSTLSVSMSGRAVVIPLVLTSSVNSMIFADTSVSSTSSQTFTVSAGGFSSVEETVTVSDDSNEFNFSPSSFVLTGSGASQTVTATFSPTSVGVKTGNITLSSSGGSTKVVSLQGTSPDPYSANISLLLKGDGPNNSTNIVDSSANNFSVTVNGNAKISTSQSKFGGSSLYFDGNGDYLDFNTSNSNAFAFGTGDFTIEFWIKSSGTDANILNPATLSGGGFWGLLIQSSNLRWNNSYNATNLWQTNCAFMDGLESRSIIDGNWHHVAISRASSVTRVFFDGVWVNTFNDSTNYTYSNVISDGLRMGKGNLSDLNGYIDDLRITKGVARYTDHFTPPGDLVFVDPYAANVSFLLKGDGPNNSTNIVDSSANNLSINRYGDTKISTSQSKFGGSSLYFDGVSDYLTVQQSSLIQMGTSDFTIEGWVYINTFNNSGASGIFQISPFGFNGSTTNSVGIHLFANNTWALYANNNVYTSAVNKWSLNTWHHFAVVRNSGVTKLYIDGIELINTSDNVNYTGQILGIGSIYFADTYEFNGYIDDFRVTKGSARYKSNFTPPGAL